MIETYRPSGRCNPLVLVMAIPLILVLGAAAWLYQTLVYWIPLIYVNVLVTIAFAWLIMLGTGMVIQAGKCRNVAIGALIGLVVSLCATAATHYVSARHIAGEWVDAISAENPDVTVAGLLDNPGVLTLLQLKADIGWSIGRVARSGDSGLQIKGIWVYLIWGIEAVILIAGGLMGAIGGARSPFSEVCNAWADQELLSVVLPQPAQQTIGHIQSASSVEDLIGLPLEQDQNSPQALSYALSGHPDDPADAYLTVKLITATVNKKGEAETKDEELWSNVIIDRQQLDALHQLEARVAELAAAQDDATPDHADPQPSDPQEPSDAVPPDIAD